MAARQASTKTSVRAQSKPDPLATRAVFRPVLSNPLNLAWPTLSAPVRAQILEALCAFLLADEAHGVDIARWRTQEHARRKQGQVLPTGKGNSRKRLKLAATEQKGQGALVRSEEAPRTELSASTSKLDSPALPRPTVLHHLAIGINAVTRALESRIRWGRWELGDARAFPSALPADGEVTKGTRRGGGAGKRVVGSRPAYAFLDAPVAKPDRDVLPAYMLPPSSSLPFIRLHPDGSKGPRPPRKRRLSAAEDEVEMEEHIPMLDLLFICKPDINPPSLVAHLPAMVAASNGILSVLSLSPPLDTSPATSTARPDRETLLVSLDLGAEARLAEVLGLRRVAALGVSCQAPHVGPLLALMQQHLTPLHGDWLVPHLSHLPEQQVQRLIPTHIKHLKSVAPVNMRAAVLAKKEAKDKRRRAEEAGVYVAED